jgi:hypothetical protein
MKSIKQYKPRRSISSKQYSPKKKSAREKGYDREWDRFRFRFLHYNKHCYVCGEPSKVVDHCIPARVDHDRYFWDKMNFLPLCIKCHNFVTGKFDRHEPPKTEEKMIWLEETRRQTNTNVKVKIVNPRR